MFFPIARKSHASHFTVLQGLDGELFDFNIIMFTHLVFNIVYYLLCTHSAPVLVAIALIEYGMDAITAVSFIRERR